MTAAAGRCDGQVLEVCAFGMAGRAGSGPIKRQPFRNRKRSRPVPEFHFAPATCSARSYYEVESVEI
jgi:hypothetical protein